MKFTAPPNDRRHYYRPSDRRSSADVSAGGVGGRRLSVPDDAPPSLARDNSNSYIAASGGSGGGGVWGGQNSGESCQRSPQGYYSSGSGKGSGNSGGSNGGNCNDPSSLLWAVGPAAAAAAVAMVAKKPWRFWDLYGSAEDESKESTGSNVVLALDVLGSFDFYSVSADVLEHQSGAEVDGEVWRRNIGVGGRGV